MTQAGRIAGREISQTMKDRVLAEEQECAYCSDVRVPLQVDHYVPLSRGGTNDRDNLKAVCVSCNSQKRAMLFHEWRMYRQTHGMPWPPLASYATDPRHYGDSCEQCDRRYHDLAYERLGPSRVNFSCVPNELRYAFHKGDPRMISGFKGFYSCPAGHHWTCWYALATWYFSDCPCMWCQVARDDNEEKTYPAPVRYSDEESPLKKLILGIR